MVNRQGTSGPSWRTRLVLLASTALITAGLVILLDIGMTLAWGEPISGADAWLEQREAADELERTEARYEAGTAAADSGNRFDPVRLREAAGELAAETSHGDALGRIRVPDIDLSIVVVEGTGTADLQSGPGHYPDSPLPGQAGTVAIAGHRTTYLAPFRDLDALKAGDEIVLEMPYGDFHYRVAGTRIVDPSQVGVVRDVGEDRLVLTACNPLYSAAERIVVTAPLTRVGPRTDSAEGGSAGSSVAGIGGLGPAIASAAGIVLISLLMWVATGRRARRDARF